MLSKRRILGAGTCSLALLSLAASTASANAAQPALTSPAGHVYVNDNTAPANTLAGFQRGAGGSLIPLPGSPFAIGGSGLGKGLGSQGATQFADNGQYILAVDAGSNQISVLRVGSGGEPQPVAGSPFSSGGVDPVSIAVAGDVVYVTNQGGTGVAPNVTSFYLAPWGALYPRQDSSAPLPGGSAPGDVVVSPNGQNVAVTLVASSQIASFSVTRRNGLLPAAGSPFAAQALGPFGSEFRPASPYWQRGRFGQNVPSQLYVTNAHGGEGAGSVSAFNVSSSGLLSSIGLSPVADLQTAPCWLTISSSGEYLFAVNTGSGTVSSYRIEPAGALVLIGSTPPLAAGAGAADPRLSPDGSTLYVNASRADEVLSFAVAADGKLTAQGSTPLPVGASAAGIVVD
jgi:hypothetical protein